jgi:hypothetical protein
MTIKMHPKKEQDDHHTHTTTFRFDLIQKNPSLKKGQYSPCFLVYKARNTAIAFKESNYKSNILQKHRAHVQNLNW